MDQDFLHIMENKKVKIWLKSGSTAYDSGILHNIMSVNGVISLTLDNGDIIYFDIDYIAALYEVKK